MQLRAQESSFESWISDARSEGAERVAAARTRVEEAENEVKR